MPANPPHRPRRLRVSLRIKLLSISLALLIIPWIGYQYVQTMEAYLRHGQEDAVLATARAVATVLREQPQLFEHTGDVLRAAHQSDHLYVRPLHTPIQLDGYADDWRPYLDRAQHFGAAHLLVSRVPYSPKSLSFTQLVGSYKHYLYVLFEVTDDHIVYRDPNSLRLDQCDHLEIALQAPDGSFHRYLLATTAPGWVNAHLMSNDPNDPIPVRPEVRIKGEWQETAHGYNLEIRIPLSMIGNKLAFAIADVDNPKTRRVDTVIGTAGTQRLDQLGTVMMASPRIERLLKGLEHSGGRIWVIDRNHRVLALAGSLHQDDDGQPKTDAPPRSFLGGVMHAFYRMILKQPATQFQDSLSAASRLNGPEIEAALHGRAATQWRQTPDRRVTILAAAHPVWSGNQVLGAVVVERTSNDILLLQNRAMEHLINLSLAVFLLAAILLLTFATRLSGRVRRLRDDAERAIGADGRVHGSIRVARASDEIGDLSRSYANVLERLGQYTRYLETMAGKLSHELRTPLAVVRSSLENLEFSGSANQRSTYTERAREGVRRLENIVTRMSEATRLEQALQQAEPERFDLDSLVAGCVEGYRSAYAPQTFELKLPDQSVTIRGVPDLLAQMLDKLVANAVEFSNGPQPVEVQLRATDGHALLTVSNQGPTLPEQMQGNLFDSMVSIRDHRAEESHLGLGLYIVRLIADFHHGHVQAANRPDAAGAQFTVSLPTA